MTSRYRLQRIKTCANCGHHKSAHQYDPHKPRSGPQRCAVPSCSCTEFRQLDEGERVPRGGMVRNESTDYPDQDAFIRELQGLFSSEVNERQVHYRMRAGALHVTYVNLPRGAGGAGGGAEAQNNRMSFDVDGFPSTTYHAMWGGKLKIEQSTTFDRSRKLRAKTASPSAIAQYLAAYLNKFAAEVPPRFTHTHTSNARRKLLPSQRNEPAVGDEIEATFDVSNVAAGVHTDEATAHFEHGQWWVTCNCGAQWSVVDTSHGFDFEQVSDGDDGFHEADGDYENNGRRTGILSDGTRVNVYHQPGTLDEYTVVPHNEDWDSMEHGGMRSMLGLSATGRGFSQWTEGQEGKHLGRSVPWDAVPDELKRHIEQRVVGETMVANARGSTVDEHAATELSLYIENEYALIGDPNSIGKSIDTNLRKKLAAGKYDPAVAPKAWQYLIDEGAKRYGKAYGSGSPIFSAATRRQVAADFAKAWEDENLPRPAGRS